MWSIFYYNSNVICQKCIYSKGIKSQRWIDNKKAPTQKMFNLPYFASTHNYFGAKTVKSFLSITRVTTVILIIQSLKLTFCRCDRGS